MDNIDIGSGRNPTPACMQSLEPKCVRIKRSGRRKGGNRNLKAEV